MSKSSFVEFVESRSDQRFGLVESGGNHGDRLIYEGAKAVFDRNEVSLTNEPYYHPQKRLGYRIRRELNERLMNTTGPLFCTPDLGNVDIVGIHGGANVNDLWGHGIDVLRTLLDQYPNRPLVVLPHTFWFTRTNFANILAGTSQPIHLFCRESYSYSLLDALELPENVSIYRSDDTAFHLDGASLREQANSIDADPGYDLLGFRDDRESVVPRSEVERLRQSSDRYVEGDISSKSDYDYGTFLALVDQADTVYTDRLHVGILSHLLETSAVLYENAYFKTRGVYRYSLEDSEYVTFESAI